MKKPKKKLCFSKIIVIVVIVMYIEAVIVGQVAMFAFHDISSLEVMWINIVPPIIAIIAYYIKAAKENCKGGITYDAAMKEEEEDE